MKKAQQFQMIDQVGYKEMAENQHILPHKQACQISQLLQKSQSVQDAIENEKPLNKPPSHTYRPDIDGLRTIAITTVIIFHAFPEFMTGGFIGVDVFFVISGYLISQIIIKETMQERFSYIDFYSRRIKRIYPALLLILCFVVYVVPKAYAPEKLIFTFKTLIASTVFGANFQVLVHEKGYFDADIKTNPLLHLWSLGVQEQFYIFWPCLISIGLNFFKKKTFHILTFYTVLSFIIAIVSVYISAKFAFYFPICRFWQMAVGGLVAYLNIKIQDQNINNALSIGGTSAILITVWIVSDQSLFPGFWALIPTLSAACIIQAGGEPFINKQILSSKVFVFVGKISYPLYLWHWPLLVFSRYFYPPGSDSILGNLYFVILVTIVLSILTYYLVENQLRLRKTKIITLVLLILMASVGVWSYMTLQSSRVKFNYDNNLLQTILSQAQPLFKPRPIADYVERNGKMHPNFSVSKNRQKPTVFQTKVAKLDEQIDYYEYGGQHILEKKIDENSKYYVKGGPLIELYEVANEGSENQVFLIGDSHGMKLSYRFQQLHRQSIKNNKTDSFPTVVAMIRRGFQLGPANYLLNFSISMIKQHKPKRVLLACDWITYHCSNKFLNPQFQYEKMERNFKGFFKYVKDIQNLGVQVSVLSIDMRAPNFNPASMSDINGIIEENIKPVKLSEFKKRFKVIIDKFEPELKKMNVNVIDLSDNLCWEDNCQVTSPAGYAIFVDTNHFGKFYSRHWISAVDYLVQF